MVYDIFKIYLPILLKMTYLNLVSIKDYPFKEKYEYLALSALQNTTRKLVLLLTEWSSSRCVSEKFQTSGFLSQKSNTVTDNNHSLALCFIPVIRSTYHPICSATVIPVVSAKRFKTHSQQSKFLVHFWQTKKK